MVNIARRHEDGRVERYCYSKSIWGIPMVDQFWHLADGTIVWNDSIQFGDKEEGNEHFKALLRQGFKKINY